MSEYKSARVMAKDRAQRDTEFLTRVHPSPTRWTTDDGDLVVDLRCRVRRTHRLPHIPPPYNHVTKGPAGCRVRVGFARQEAGTCEVLSLVVNRVKVHVLTDSELGSALLFPWLVPGLRGAMGTGMWTWNPDRPVRGRYENLDVRAQQSWGHLPVVHAALLDPSAWWGGTRRIAGIGGLRHLLGWASIGAVSAREAADWAATGLRPDDVVNWRAAGWGDADLRAWATDGAGWDPKTAAAFKAAGLGRVHARGWLVNALALNPRTAGRLHRAGWSPTGAAQVRRALKAADRHLAFAGLVEQSLAGWSGDIALERWAVESGVNAPTAVFCIQAGMSVTEVAALVADGRFDRRAAQVMAALTA